jgi:hypothetical protein
MSMQELDEKLSIINRVVIRPKYRTVGLGARIIRETLALAGTPYVEMVAVMAKYNPFAEKAGLQKVAEQQPLKGVKRIAEMLSEFGFNLSLLGSERYVSEKFSCLNSAEISVLKDVFVENSHPRFRKEFRRLSFFQREILILFLAFLRFCSRLLCRRKRLSRGRFPSAF